VNDSFGRMAGRLAEEGRIHPAREVTRRGMWRRVGPEFTKPRSGRARPGGLWIIESNCTEPERLEEFPASQEPDTLPCMKRTAAHLRQSPAFPATTGLA